MTLALTLRNLRVSDGRGRDLLAIDALEVAAGRLVGVRGPSGAGKSTLLHALAGLADHMTGAVRWGGTDLAALPAARRGAFRARHMGLIFQDFLLFEELDPLANAALAALFLPRPRRAAVRSGAARHLDRLGIAAAPRAVASFSGGERQRVAVARALANDADILLADEPTASLDRVAADRLIDDLVALARAGGKTLIAVSHDQAVLDHMDRVLTLKDGALA